MIVHEHGKYKLKTSDGKRTLGIHASRAEAVAQEQAIKASEARADEIGVMAASAGLTSIVKATSPDDPDVEAPFAEAQDQLLIGVTLESMTNGMLSAGDRLPDVPGAAAGYLDAAEKPSPNLGTRMYFENTSTPGMSSMPAADGGTADKINFEQTAQPDMDSDGLNIPANRADAAEPEVAVRVRRFDYMPLPKPERMDNGWLRTTGRLTRSGVFPYHDGAGKIRYEFRPPEEVFKADSLASFGMVPIVVDHPPEGSLNANNTANRQVGTVGTDVRQDADQEHVIASLMITSAKGIAAAQAGKQELSLGYSCDIDETPGTYKGIRYDCVQRNIRGNHLALVDMARAGPEARIRLDASDAVSAIDGRALSFHLQGNTPQPPKASKATMRTIRIDGVDFNCEDQTAQAISKMQQSFDADIKSLNDTNTAAVKAATVAQARADSADAKIKTLEGDLAKAKDPASMRDMIRARAELEGIAKHVGAQVKVDAADVDLKKAILARVNPALKLDGKDDLYVNTAFDFCKSFEGSSGGTQRADAGDIPAPRYFTRPDLESGKPSDQVTRGDTDDLTYNRHLQNMADLSKAEVGFSIK